MISGAYVEQCIVYLNKKLKWKEIKSIQWKNKKASGKEAYCPTNVEHLANIFTHGIWVVPSIIATLHLASRSQDSAQLLSALVYGATLVFLFSISTCFHCIFYCNRHHNLKDILHRCDRGMIYMFIAGSYFPWLMIEPIPTHGWACSMRWIVWLMALLGIIYQQTFHEKYKTLETLFYLTMGVGPSLTIVQEHEISGIWELTMGGLLYMIGIVFFKSDGLIPFAHAIWHIFVVLAAAVHYYAILTHLYPSDTTQRALY